VIDLDELERLAIAADRINPDPMDNLGASMRFEGAANPTAILELVAELREARAEVKRLKALNQRAAACIESLAMPDAAYNLVAELKEAAKDGA